MNDADLLRARGWREASPGRWASSWRDDPNRAYPMRDALWITRECDKGDVIRCGSVTYHPTAEQATTHPIAALLQALAAKGVTEREVIGALCEYLKDVERTFEGLTRAPK